MHAPKKITAATFLTLGLGFGVAIGTLLARSKAPKTAQTPPPGPFSPLTAVEDVATDVAETLL